jgi:hypothetical protein
VPEPVSAVQHRPGEVRSHGYAKKLEHDFSSVQKATVQRPSFHALIWRDKGMRV